MIYFIISLIWIGIGFNAAIVSEGSLKGGLKAANPEGGAWFVRICWIIFWPINLIGYVVRGL